MRGCLSGLARLGPRFGSSGKRDSVFGHIVGRAFRMGCAAETVSQNIGLERDAFSQTALKRKLHPALERQNGMRFPLSI